jgi:hypothetical protein
MGAGVCCMWIYSKFRSPDSQQVYGKCHYKGRECDRCLSPGRNDSGGPKSGPATSSHPRGQMTKKLSTYQIQQNGLCIILLSAISSVLYKEAENPWRQWRINRHSHHCSIRNGCWNMRRRKSERGGKVSVRPHWDVHQGGVRLPNRHSEEARDDISSKGHILRLSAERA